MLQIFKKIKRKFLEENICKEIFSNEEIIGMVKFFCQLNQSLNRELLSLVLHHLPLIHPIFNCVDADPKSC